MTTPHLVLRNIGFVGMGCAVLWVLTREHLNFLLFIAFPLMVLGSVYNTVDNWRKGKRLPVYIQLATLLVAAIYLLVAYA